MPPERRFASRALGRVFGLTAAHKDRWKPMLIGLAVAGAGVEVTLLVKPPELVVALLWLLVLAAWFVGACAMVGYVRWFFLSELAQAKRENPPAGKERK